MAIRRNNSACVVEPVVDFDKLTTGVVPFDSDVTERFSLRKSRLMEDEYDVCYRKKISFLDSSLIVEYQFIPGHWDRDGEFRDDDKSRTLIYQVDGSEKNVLCVVSGKPNFEFCLFGKKGLLINGSTFFSYSDKSVIFNLPCTVRNCKLFEFGDEYYCLERKEYRSAKTGKYYPRYILYSSDGFPLVSNAQNISFSSVNERIIVNYSQVKTESKTYDNSYFDGKRFRDRVRTYSYFSGVENRCVDLEALHKKSLDYQKQKKQEQKKLNELSDLRSQVISKISSIVDDPVYGGKIDFGIFNERCLDLGISPELKERGGIVFYVNHPGLGRVKFSGGQIGFDWNTLSFRNNDVTKSIKPNVEFFIIRPSEMKSRHFSMNQEKLFHSKVKKNFGVKM